ncbi:MAG: methyl-accepting chemotaxis protein [Lachnospiraceae bacterium]|nr:methyl-accepting chemotaxis protein [Lachnospiraceae bacterium]
MKKKTSIRALILGPVLLLGIVSILSNVIAMSGLKKVNNTATVIADEYLEAISELDTIGQTAKDVHVLALSHIVATDFETMASVVGDIEAKEALLYDTIVDFKKYSNATISQNYNNMLTDYQSLKDAVRILLAQSANQKTKDAYATANGEVAQCSLNLDSDINTIISSIKSATVTERGILSTNYRLANIMTIIVVAISAVAVIIAIFVVSRYVIRPVIKAEAELQDIIQGINNRQGDLTKRITVTSRDEIGALGSGINEFIERLQSIFVIITNNSSAMDKVVSDVLGSVQTSNNSASDLSALTEELSATMTEVAESAVTINKNTEAVRAEVDEMATKSREISDYSKQMKKHADSMEETARTNMEETNNKVEAILSDLNKAISDSESVDKVNTLTDEIMSIASKTNLLSLNASIEAARAGEMGKGFAVVAGEIGILAENSRKTAGDIQQINSIVVEAVHNLSSSANDLVDYLKNSILPEFERFVKDGEAYRDNANYVDSVMTDFTKKTDGFKVSFDEIAESISSITTAIDEGVKGVSSAAESTQNLVYDMDNITKRMDENQRIAGELDEETAIFTSM